MAPVSEMNEVDPEYVPLIDLDTEDQTVLADQIIGACKKYGFMQFTNHGVPPKMLKETMDIWRKFYKMPTEYKDRYKKGGQLSPGGYISIGKEWLNAKRNADLKECYNIILNDAPLPDIEGLEKICIEMDNILLEISKRILRLIAKGLNLEEDHFSKHHSAYPLSYPPKISGMRSLYYPPLKTFDSTENAIRCGEHSDCCAITLLFQDMSGGLQLLGKDGIYFDVTPKEGVMLVNISDIFQVWTGNRLVSTKHRVVFTKNADDVERMSLAYFASPDADVLIETTPVIGSNDKCEIYEPQTTLDYLNKMFSSNFY